MGKKGNTSVQSMVITQAIIICIISLAIISYMPVFRDFILFPKKVRVEAISEQRFKLAKQMLPEHGVIGYWSDCSNMHDYNCIAQFYIAQYALSPLILDRSAKQPFILGNFSNAGNNQREWNGSVIKLLMDSGNGVKLYLMDGKLILLCLSFSISLLTGFFLASLFSMRQKKSCLPLLLRLSIAVGLGFGISSALYFIHLYFGPSTNRLAIMETVLLVSLFFLYIYSLDTNSISQDSYEKPTKGSVYRKILLVGFSSTCVFALLTFLIRSLILPHGGWDAWQTWNLFARFFFRGGDQWRDAFTTLLNPHHPNYPLLIPATIARSWQYIGSETQLVSIVTAGLFTFATIGLLFSSLSLLKGKGQALLAGIILAGTPNYIILGSRQYADVPLGFFFLAALVLLSYQEKIPENHNLSLLAGIMAGLTCWTKNEGFLFLLSIILAQVISFRVVDSRKTNKYVKRLLSFFAGAAPVLALVLLYKWNIAPANDLVSGQGLSQIFIKLRDTSRYLLIMKSFFLISLNICPLGLLMIFYSFYLKISFTEENKRLCISLLLTLSLMLSGYFLVYVITPYDLDWHLDTSFSRLLMQLWPSIIFTSFLMSYTPEEALSV